MTQQGSGTSEGGAQLSPDLIAALDDAARSDASLTVVYQFKGSAGHVVPAAEEIESLARRVLEDAVRVAHTTPQGQNVLRNVGSLIIKGTVALHRALVARPEIRAAMLSTPANPPANPPVRKGGPARESDWVKLK
jgi:hypothetical protein